MTRSEGAAALTSVRLPGSRRRLARAHFVVLAVVPVLAAGTVAGALARVVFPILTLGYLTLIFGLLMATPWVNQRPGLVNLRSEDHGLVFPGSDYSRKIWKLIFRSMVIGPVLLVALVVSGEIFHNLRVISLCVLLTVVMVAGPREMRRWRRAEVRLEFSQVLVELPNGHGYALRWDAVSPLSDRPTPLARMLARDADPKHRFSEAELCSDPVLVAEIIEFYRTNPHLRSELATGRCIDRIREGRFRAA